MSGQSRICNFFVFSFLFLAVSCVKKPQVLHPILSDFGRIDKVLICEIDGDSSPSDNRTTDISQVAKYFHCNGIDVCLLRHVLYSDESFFHDSIIQWNLKAPCNANGDFNVIKFKGQIPFDFRELTPIERVEFLIQFEKLLSDLVWDEDLNEWRNDSEGFIVSSSQLQTLPRNVTFNKEMLVKRIESVEKTFDTCGVELNFREYRIPWSSICEDDSINCYREITESLDHFAQDQFHVRDADSLLLTFRNQSKSSKLKSIYRQRYANQICHSGFSNSDSLRIKGGNYFFNDGIIFIGKDQLGAFISKQDWALTLGLKVNSSKSEIEKALINQISANQNGSNIIWVDNTRIDSASSDKCNYENLGLIEVFKELYHIDIFFHPFGRINLNQPNKWYYIISSLKERFHDVSSMDSATLVKFKELQNKLNQSAERLYCDISKLGYEPQPIEIPLVMEYRTQSPITLSLANGISSRTKTGCSFLLPKSSFDSQYYLEAIATAIDSLEKNGINTDVVEGDYSSDSGLHCKVKVLKRTP